MGSLEITLFALLGGVLNLPLMHMVGFENLKNVFFFRNFTNTSSLKNAMLQYLTFCLGIAILFSAAFVQLDEIESTHSRHLTLKTQ